jgi:diguanylate cyclase (GGDEF)-like protein/PAS domain S-box-containing protein
VTALLDVLGRTRMAAVAVFRPIHDDDGSIADFETLLTSEVGHMSGHPGALEVGTRLSSWRSPQAAHIAAIGRELLPAGGDVRRELPLPGAVSGFADDRRIVLRALSADGLLVVLWSDITAAHRAREELERSERRFRLLVERASDPIITLAADGVCTYATPALSQLVGVELDKLVGQDLLAFVHPDDTHLAVALLRRVSEQPGATVTAQLRITGGDGITRWVQIAAVGYLDDPAVRAIIVNVRDISEQRAAEQRLHHHTLHDELTGLPNRRSFLDAVRTAIERSARSRLPLAMMEIDVDNFKILNDSLGHPAGDRLLVQLSARMRDALRPADHVARLGGDEFVVLVEDLQHEEDALALAERLVAAAGGTYSVDGLSTVVTLSVGVTVGDGVSDPDGLLAAADAALYEAKRRGRDRIEVSDPTLREHVLHRLHLGADLHRAVDRGEFVLHWQPILRSSDGSLAAAEALLRWNHPERGFLTAGEFLPIASDAGAMPAISAWVLDNVMAQAAAWQWRNSGPDVFFNLDHTQLLNRSLAVDVARVAADHGVDPARLHLELSERTLTSDFTVIVEHLHQLRGQGFSIALDDFGAGNTALAWLQRLPLDLLKLDRTFIATLEQASTRAIVGSLVTMSRALGIRTVAEGIETADQLAVVTELGCDYGQGYYLARPQPAAQLEELLR